MTMSRTKSTTTTSTRIIISSVGLGVILGLSALLVLPLQNQAFADTEIRGSGFGTFNCANGNSFNTDLLSLNAREQGGEWSGSWRIDNAAGTPFIEGDIDKGRLTPAGKFILRGTVDRLNSNDCGYSGNFEPYNMHFSGECGSSTIKFRSEIGEEATYSSSVNVECTTTN
jgi:hypothetical protein